MKIQFHAIVKSTENGTKGSRPQRFLYDAKKPTLTVPKNAMLVTKPKIVDPTRGNLRAVTGLGLSFTLRGSPN
jgi:hypothetical protein